MLRPLFRAAVSCFALSLLVSPARADTSAADKAAARALGVEGVKLANRGKCAEAVEKLERAEKLYHAPTTLERLGACNVELGKLVQGTEQLRRVVRERLASNAPQAFVAAHSRAEKLLGEAQPRIPYLHLVVVAPADAAPEVTVDGDKLSSAAIGTDWPIDPGEHVVEVSAAGYLKAQKQFALKESEKREVTLTLEPDPNAVKPKPAAATPSPLAGTEPDRTGPASTTPAESPPSRVPAYTTLGIGVVGAAVGAIAGAIFLNDASNLKTSCPNKQCPPSHSDDLSTTKTWGTISTVGFAVGAVGLATGFILLLTSGSSSSPSQRAAVRPVVGLGYAGVDGRF